jgi:hypothetical protein
MSRDRMVRVFAELPAYSAAVAELPLSTAITDARRGAVVVVPGSGDWRTAMQDAMAAGAVALVLADPAVLRREAVEAVPWPRGIPVIVERPRLRPDVVADALLARRGSPPRLITVECAAPAAALDGVILDGFGWARSLTEAPLALHASIATVQGRIALLESRDSGDGPVPATLACTPIGGLHPGGLLQVLALGEVRTEVTLDQPARLARVETFTEEGALRAHERFESSARLALRRAIDACLSDGPTADLEELLQDMALARSLLDT